MKKYSKFISGEVKLNPGRKKLDGSNVVGRLFAIILLGLLVLACEQTNPVLNTVVTAHGNTDWHIDTAEEFLFGTEMGGASTAANHVPDTWVSRRHMHIGSTNMNQSYYDSTLSVGGQDTDSTTGIDTAMLFFYAGHGNPTLWNTLGNNATQSNMLLANNEEGNKGLLRYYWQCSCQVFAHGPNTCPAGDGTDFTYSCPEHFDGSADSSSMRNVYERWGPALGADLRMACGASTSAYCHESQTNGIWDNYNNNSYDVADSFIYGLRGPANVVPLCITRGNFGVTSTPLYDTAFTNLANPVGGGLYMHIQYLSNFDKNPPWLIVAIPELLPLYLLQPMELPQNLANIKFIDTEELLLSPDEVDTRGARVRVNKNSGAVSVLDTLKKEPVPRGLTEDEYFQLASAYVEEQGWDDGTLASPLGTFMKIQSAADRGKGEVSELQKNLKVNFGREIFVDGLKDPIPVLGKGGKIALQMNNDGTVFGASKIWRKLDKIAEMLPVKSYEQALEEAMSELREPEKYQLGDWKFGYKEQAGNVAQQTLGVVYQFTFVPVSEEILIDYPPVYVELDGFAQ